MHTVLIYIFDYIFKYFLDITYPIIPPAQNPTYPLHGPSPPYPPPYPLHPTYGPSPPSSAHYTVAIH